MHAVLTVAWGEACPGAVPAAGLYAEARTPGGLDATRVARALRALPPPPTVSGLDALFRRHGAGFEPVKRLVATLARLEAEGLGPVRSRVNAITYAFLQGAKNFDLLLPEDRGVPGPFRAALPGWRAQIAALEAFERDGDRPADPWLGDAYLRLRPILARGSARDERRSLAVLLIAGPSSLEEIERDLGLSYDLSQRVLAPLVAIDLVERSAADQRFAVTNRALPLVLFALRETLGIDPLAVLGD
jgi:hypothetical protein